MKTNKFNSKLVCMFLTIVLFAGTNCFADVLDTVPAESFFCVKVNSFDNTLGQVDQFLMGASPMGPVSVSMLARMQIANILGDPSLASLDTAGDFVIFGMAETKESKSEEPDIVVAALLPVKDYEQFISMSPNVGQPGADGVSKITYTTGGMGGPNAEGVKQKTLLAVKAGQFALVGPEEKRAKLLSVAKSASKNSMTKQLDAEQKKMAGEMPLWAYADLEQVNKAFGAKIEKAFAEMENKMKGMSGDGEKMPGGNIEEIMKVYADMAKTFLHEGKYASVSLKPEPTVLRIKKVLAAKPGTDMAGLLTASETLPKENKLVGYLRDGATVNIAAKFDKSWMKKLSELGMSFMNAGATGEASEEEKAKWEKLANDSIEATGQLLAASIKASQGTPPFEVEYYIEIEDKEKYDKMMDESIELMKTGSFSKMYGMAGIKMDFNINRGADEYKGVKIDTAKLTIKVTDTNSPEAQMIQAVYGDGLDYRMAHTDGLLLTAISDNPDATIRKMIDSVKAGDKQLSSEVKSTMTLLGGAEEADFVGTLNYIRLMQMMMGFVPMPMPIPFDQIPTKSNIAFAGNVGDGKVTADIAFPKEHLVELMTGMQMIMQQQMQQQQMQQGGNSP